MTKKDMGLSKVKYFDPKKVKKIAQRHVTKMMDRVFQKGLDKDGNQFPAYSESYKKLINKDFRRKDGKRYKGYEQIPATTAGKISKRNPRLRGLTAKKFRAVSWHKDYYEIGWTVGEFASIMKWLEESGRDAVSGIPSKEFDWVANQFGLTAESEWRKMKNVTVVVGK